VEEKQKGKKRKRGKAEREGERKKEEGKRYALASSACWAYAPRFVDARASAAALGSPD